MEFVSGVLDYGTAPEVYVDGVERVTLTGPGIVRVTLFAPFETNKTLQLRTALHLLWDRQRFLEMGTVYDRARAAVALSNAFKVAGR